MSTPAQPEAQSGRPESHQLRQVAESFGVNAERYDRTRPRYPAALVDTIVSASPGPGVVDVGTGTGIVARQLQEAGCTVLGVEPDERMADFARGTGVEVEVATFEAWEPAGRVFDAVIAGQAWHWVDPVAGGSKAAAALRPGGLLALFWHVYQLPPEVAGAYNSAYRRVVPDSPFTIRPDGQPIDAYLAMCARAASAIRDLGGFGEPGQLRFDWDQRYSRDECLDLLPTTGALTQLPADKLAEVLAATAAAIDAMGGSFVLPYITVGITFRRAAAG
jgi:SAM-dependent methyltransferase